jgi:tryptophan synthase alpha chain
LIDRLQKSLDADGKVTAGTITAVTSLVSELADGVRSVRGAAAE